VLFPQFERLPGAARDFFKATRYDQFIVLYVFSIKNLKISPLANITFFFWIFLAHGLLWHFGKMTQLS